MVVLGRLKHYHTWLLCNLVSNFVVLCGFSTHLRSVDLIVSVQCRAALWIQSSFDPLTLQWTKSSDECIRELGWPPWSCDVIMLVLWYFMLYLTILLQLANFSENYRLNKLPLVLILWRFIRYPLLSIVITIPFAFFGTQFHMTCCQLLEHFLNIN